MSKEWDKFRRGSKQGGVQKANGEGREGDNSPNGNDLVGFIRKNPEGLFGVVVSDEERISDEVKCDRRFRLFTDRQIRTRLAVVDSLSCLVIIAGRVGHDLKGRFKDRAKSKNIPMFYFPTTQTFNKAMAQALRDPAPNGEKREEEADLAKPNPDDEADKDAEQNLADGQGQEPLRSIAKLTDDERVSCLIELLYTIEDVGNGVMTSASLNQFMQTWRLKVGTSRQCLVNGGMIQPAGNQQRTSIWQTGPALRRFAEQLAPSQEALPAETRVPTPGQPETEPSAGRKTAPITARERLAQLDEQRKRLHAEAASELDTLIGASKEHVAKLEEQLSEARSELARLEEERVKLGSITD